MESKEAMRAAVQELIVPELDHIRRDQAEMKAQLTAVHKRLDDVNAHLVDQSRRIDETNKRVDAIREDLGQRIEETNKRIDAVRQDLTHRIDKTHTRMDRLYEVIVRREEHEKLEQRLRSLERDVAELKRRVA
jgi:predicted nuclease with TOPRIM domain